MCGRFRVDTILETCPVKMQVDHDYIVELINEGKSVSDVTIDIYDNQRKTIYGNGKELTLKEVVNLLNDYDNENIELKKENQSLKSENDILNSKIDVHIYLTEHERMKVRGFIKKLEWEMDNLKKALWEAEESYIYETNDNSIDIEKDMEYLKKEFERKYWQDESEI